MVKKKHKEYTLEDLKENKDTAIGKNRMVDPHVNPNPEDYDFDLKHGIDPKRQKGKKRWTVNAYDYDNPDETKTPKMTVSELKQIIREAIHDFYISERRTKMKSKYITILLLTLLCISRM